MDVLAGRRLGKYQLEALVGRGGMAAVYRAHDTVLNRAVAIKVLEPSLAHDPRAVERFKREAVTSANLEHPNIVRVYDVQEESGTHYIAMRFVQGTTLRDILRDNGPLPLDAVLNIIGPVAAALHYAHRHGVIHRDVKPGNILVEPDGNVLLTDFGIARAADSAQAGLTATGLVMGTADYLAPEQIAGRPAEPRSDIYSLGVVLYEMLTGVTPFAGENTASILYRQVHDPPPPLRSINPRLPAELQPVIDRALTKNPALRHADALDLARDLEVAAQWLPPGSPWLNRGRPPAGQYQDDRSQPQMGDSGPAVLVPRVYTGELYEEQVSQYPRASSQYPVPGSDYRKQAPDAGLAGIGRRRTLLVFGVLMLLAGAVVLVMATTLFAGKDAEANRAFQPPGEATYTGQPRPGGSFSIPRALVAPTIDGNLSDWEGATPSAFEAGNVIAGEKGLRPPDGPDDFSATFNFAWDDDNFYISALITDDVHVQFASTRSYNLYRGDDIEIWFDTDLAGDFATRTGNGDDYQLGLSPGDFGALTPEAVFWNPDKKDARNKMVAVAALPREGNNGYTLEASVPWAAFGEFRPTPGGAIGFAASAGDNDQRGTAIQELMLATAPELRYKEPPTFGTLFF